MAGVERAVDRAAAALGPLGPIDARAMFGGWGLYLDGAMLAIVAEEVLYLKVDSETKQTFVDAGLEPFTYTGKHRPVAMSFHRAPPPLDDWESLEPFARLALEAANRALSARTRTKRRGA